MKSEEHCERKDMLSESESREKIVCFDVVGPNDCAFSLHNRRGLFRFSPPKQSET